MSHKRVDRTERRTLDEVLVNETVAIGYPLLAVVADTSLSEVAFLTPNGLIADTADRSRFITDLQEEDAIWRARVARLNVRLDD